MAKCCHIYGTRCSHYMVKCIWQYGTICLASHMSMNMVSVHTIWQAYGSKYMAVCHIVCTYLKREANKKNRTKQNITYNFIL